MIPHDHKNTHFLAIAPHKKTATLIAMLLNKKHY